jgi:Fic family protein
MKFIHELKDWPNFHFDKDLLLNLIADVNKKQGHILAILQVSGFDVKSEIDIENMAMEILKSSEIESIKLNIDDVRSSVKRRLGVEPFEGVKNRYVDGYVEVLVNAVKTPNQPLTKMRLCGWHKCLFPSGFDDYGRPMEVGVYRNDKEGPMTVQSGAIGREIIHFIAPKADLIDQEMDIFLNWFNNTNENALIVSAIAHYWFVTIHPFNDGNGRLSRVIADMAFSKTDKSEFRYFSISEQIELKRKEYYSILEKTSKQEDLDITAYMHWYFNQVSQAFDRTIERLNSVILKLKFWEENKSISLNTRQVKIINTMFEKKLIGKLNTSRYSRMFKIENRTAFRDLNDLLQKNILSKLPAGGRETSYYLRVLGNENLDMS